MAQEKEKVTEGQMKRNLCGKKLLIKNKAKCEPGAD